MNAAGAAVPVVDLENGGGGGGAAIVDMWAYPADKRLKEKQPFTWRGAAPYIAVLVVGAALFAAGMLVIYYSGGRAAAEQGQPYHTTTRDVVGTALYCTGMAVVIVGFVATALADDEGCGECNLRRFEPD